MMVPVLILWVVLQAVSAAPAGTPSATIVGRVVDAGTGRIVPCTVAIRSGDGQLITDHESFRAGFRSAGEFVQTVPPGEVDIKISRGFDFIAIERKVQLQPGERYRLDIALRRRSPLRREGWYVGDNHDHMIHGERKIVVDFEYAALAARAEGLDYLALAQHWNVPTETPEALGQACERSSTPDFLLTWNLEAPKNYWRGDVSKCLGHGWTVGMRGRTDRGDDAIQELMDLSAHDYESAKEPSPNFDSHALIHELGGIVSYSHPCRWWWGKWGGTGIYPVEERKFVSNMAAELPFDTVAGPTYDAIDILMQPHEGEANDCAQKLWFMLLDKGYHIAATGSSDATFDNPGGGVPGAVRIYTKTGEPFSLAGAARAIREGRSFVTTGPLIVLEVGGHLSGDVVRPGQQAFFRVRIRAWASGAIDERLTRVELIRNGEVVKTIEAGQKATELDRIFDITETGRAWYIARCYGSNNHQIAVTNPVYVEPEGARPPAAALAEVELSVRDLATGAPLSGDCEVIRMVGRRAVRESEVAFKAGRLRLRVPATARLEVRVPGYSSMTRSIFMDYAPLRESVFSMRAEGLSEWSAFEHVRELLKSVRLDFALRAIQ